MTRIYGRAMGGARAVDNAPINTPANTTILSSIRLNGETAYTTYSGGTTGDKFVDYLKNTLIPTLRLCEKISVKTKTAVKNMFSGAVILGCSIFLQYTKYTAFCQDTSPIIRMEWSEAEWNPDNWRRRYASLSGYIISSSPSTFPHSRSGIVHFFEISCVARYSAFRSAVSLGNTLLCLFRRR